MSTFERTTLANGVRVVTAPMTHVESTAWYVMLAAGSRYETAETSGVAHFVEHMLFCGTPRRPSVRALTGEVDAIGGLFNAATSTEWTFYYVKCASDYAPQAVDVLADMLSNSLFDEGEVEREKNVIIEEMHAKFDAPRDYVDELWERLMYGDTSLGRLTIGSEATVGAATRDTLVDFTARLYEPARIVVGLSGRVSDSLYATVEQLLGDLSSTRTDGARPAAAEEGRPPVMLDTKQIDQAQVCIGVRSYPLSHPDRYTAQLLATVLGGGMSSRLTEELTMKRGLAYSVFAINHSHTDAGSFWEQGGFNAEKVDDAVAAIVEQLRQVTDEPVSQEELDKARNYAKSRFVFSLETPQGIINHALKGEVLEGRPREPSDVLTALDRVTPDDLQRVARDLVDGGLHAAVIGPYDDPSRFERLLA